MKEKEIKSTQEWLPIKKILNNGIIQKNDDKYIKIIKVNPINFNLKSILEKESILNSYKLFLKTCNFNLQILIQSNKEDLSKHIENVKSEETRNSPNINKIAENYLQFIKELNNTKKSSNKEFYITIEENNDSSKEESVIVQELNEKFFKIKECLSRCGNLVENINKEREIKEILFKSFNIRLNNIEN